MANYLERVASSAGRRAAMAKPPNSGPPVLPVGRDFSYAAEDPFASEQDQFLEALETHAPARVEERPETPKPEVAEQSETEATQESTLRPAVEPKPVPHERLSSDSPFAVRVPRTLRPISTTNVPPAVSGEPLRERTRVRASAGSEEFTPREEPAPLVRSDVNVVSESVTAEPFTTTQTNPAVAGQTGEHQSPAPRSVNTEAAPIPRVDRVDEPRRLPVPSAEPSPPPALPVHLPPASGNVARQEQSRISIGSLEVLVNNHPRVTPSRPAPAPPRSESLNLEKRYLDRFRLRH